MGLTYDNSGVSIHQGDLWVETIKAIVAKYPLKSSTNHTIGGIGGFAGLYEIPGGMALAACCDGVGTKLELAKTLGILKGLGQDLVAMNLNDLVTCGARPLFFLDYIACGKLSPQTLSPIMEGVARSCASCGCVLLGGETAEMPQVYPNDGFDLAGFAVGLVPKDQILTGHSIQEGDVLVGLHSSGPHSNGYSLIRKAISLSGIDLNSNHGVLSRTLGQELLEPTRLYVNQALMAFRTGLVRAMAHITGGGLEGNIRRVIPEGLTIHLDYKAWQRPQIFRLIEEMGIDEAEMRKVFNLGIGFVMITPRSMLNDLLILLQEAGEEPAEIGAVVSP